MRGRRSIKNVLTTRPDMTTSYIKNENTFIYFFTISAPSSGNMPRLEPFAPGQVYNQTRTARVHVLPAPNAHNTQASLGSNFGSNPGIHDVKSNQHVSLPFY